MGLGALLLASLAPCAFAALTGAVRIESGPIEGVPALVPGVMAFEGIPYAAPPVGDLRWKPPKSPASWPVVRNADRYGPACPQNYMGPDSTAFFGDYEFKSEDCLYANVWTAAKTASDKLPVLVWIHGGGFRVGSGTERLHHGDHLAAKGVVLVTFNYRLGVFGFLAHPELTRESDRRASGNYGLMDQVFALERVKRNIAAFGGDPNRITIFGESAGSGSVSYMQATPLAKGLFQRAIGESGGSFSGRNVGRLAAAEQDGVKFAASVGASSLAELRKLPTDVLLNAASQGAGARGTASGPIVDGYVVPEDVYLIFAKGQQNAADVIAGSNSDEGTSLQQPRPNLETPADQAEMNALYPPGNDDKITSDNMLWTAHTWVRLNSKSGSHKSFQYFFSHHPPYPQPYSQFARDVTKLGAHHSAEIIYVFDNLDIRRTRNWPYTAYDRQLADMMSSYWVNFAATGNPNGKGLPNWPACDDATPRVMNFGDKVEAMPLPRGAEVKFWDKVNLKRYSNQ
jgi:para-nitrobenzyl esterase